MTVQTEIIEPVARRWSLKAAAVSLEAADLTVINDAAQPVILGLINDAAASLYPMSLSSEVTNGGSYVLTSAGSTLLLPARPGLGSRFAVSLAGGSGTINANGNRIEGALTIPARDGDWFYREDTRNWLEIAPQALGAAPLLPRVLHGHLINILAFEIHGLYGPAVLSAGGGEVAAGSRVAIMAHYGKRPGA